MQTVETNDKIVLINGEGRPLKEIGIQAAIFLPVIALLLASSIKDALAGNPENWIVLVFILGLARLMVQDWKQASYATLEIDRALGRARYERRFLLTTTEQVFAIGDIDRLDFEEAPFNEDKEGYQLILKLKDGRRLPIGPPLLAKTPIERATVALETAR